MSIVQRVVGACKSLNEKIRTVKESINSHYNDHVNPLIGIRDFIRIIYCRIVYKFESREYYYFHLYEKSKKEILEFCPKKYQAELYFKVNPLEARALATDKYASYLRFKDYYKRDACAYNPSAGLVDIQHDFNRFIEINSTFIIKPLSANSGIGIKIVETNKETDPKQLLNKFISEYPDGFIAEELIMQVLEMAQFHPKSVNTIRVNTFRFGDDVEVKFPCMRLGRGSAVVDNANAGGIFGGIDVATGKLIAVADEFGRKYSEHPDTKVKFDGFAIPRWQEVCELAKGIADDFSECKVIGFDFALTDKGWVLVEINAYPLLIFQIATQIGIRKEFEEIVNKMNKSHEG